MTEQVKIRRRIPTLIFFAAPPLTERVVAVALLLGAGSDGVAARLVYVPVLDPPPTHARPIDRRVLLMSNEPWRQT